MKSLRALRNLNTMKDCQQHFETIAQQTLEVARQHGATAAAVQIEEVESLSASVQGGKPNERALRQSTQLRLSLFLGQREASVSSSDLSQQGVAALVARGMDSAAIAAEDQHAGLPGLSAYPSDDVDLELDHPWQLGLRDAVALVARIERAALAVSSAVPQIEQAVLFSSRTRRVLANSEGFLRSSASTRHSLSCTAVAIRDGAKEIESWWDARRDPAQLPSPESIGACAGRRALARLGARQVATQTCPVLFEPQAAASLLNEFVQAISARPLYMHSSFLRDALGQEVFAAHMNISDDPLLKGGMGSRSYDGNGAALRPRTLIAGGHLQGYYLGAYGARRLGLPLAEHGAGPSNVMVSSTTSAASGDLEAMIRRMGTGLVISGLNGQGVNLMTGDFSRACSGFWVENGQIAYPVAGITVASNLREMFAGIVAVGNDRLTQNGTTTGSWLIDKMRVGGI